jgi:hypothetical protein
MTQFQYSPPHGGHPQEIPDYYRYPNGTVRTDLKTLSPQELNSLGWGGPHVPPSSRVLENVESIKGAYDSTQSTFTPELETISEITSGWISRSKNGIFSEATFNPEDNSITFPEDVVLESGPLYFITTFTDAVNPYGFDPEIERWQWSDDMRQYVVINLQDEERNRPVPPVEPPLPPQPPNWDIFESIILQSNDVKNFISFASSKNPLVAATFPAAFFEAKHGDYNSFRIVWTELVKISPVRINVLESIIGVANAVNLPKEFVKIIEDTLEHLIDGSLVTTKYPDWDTFESIVLQSNEMKNFIAFANSQNPFVASSFPAAFFEAKNNRYNSFRIIWGELIKIVPVDPAVMASIIHVAESADLPQEFVDILRQ